MSNEKIKEVNINDSKIKISDIVDIVDSDKDKKAYQKDKLDDIDDIDKIDDRLLNDLDDKLEAPEMNYKEESDVEAKRKRLMIIGRYRNSKRFGAWLKKQGFDMLPRRLEKMSNDELETMINDIRFCISTKNTNNLYETGATKGILVLESLLRPVYKIDGLSQTLSNDPTFHDLLEELLLERQSYIYVKPEYRLLYVVLSSAYIVHSHHIMLEQLSQTDEGKKMIQDIANKMEENRQPQAAPISINLPTNLDIERKSLDNTFTQKYSDLLQE